MNIFDSINWCKINEYHWDFISVIIDLLNYLIIIVTAIATYIYFKIRRLKVITISDTGGRDVIIQNISKNTVFIKDINLIVKNKNTKQKRIIPATEFAQVLPNEIEPKSFYKFNLDYILLNIEEINIVKIRIDLYNKYTYTKRIK